MTGELVRLIRDDVARQLRARIQSEDGGGGLREAPARRSLGERLIAQALERYVQQCVATGRQVPTQDEERAAATAVTDALFGAGGFQQYLDDPDIEDINANGCDRVSVKLTGGRRVLNAAPVAASDEEMVALVRQLARLDGPELRWDRGCPFLITRLPDGSRLTAVMEATARPGVAIRRHRMVAPTLAELRSYGTIDDPLQSFLSAVTRSRQNVVIGGGTGTGKTTTLRAMTSMVPPTERLITIESTVELALDSDRDRHPDCLAMYALQANTEGQGERSLAELFRVALKMSPDRIIVGECVSGGEVIEMLHAMNTGQGGGGGSLSTIHAASPEGVFNQIATYVQMATGLPVPTTNRLAAGAIDFVVYMSVVRGPLRDGEGSTLHRVVSSVLEVTGVHEENGRVMANQVFAPGPGGGGRWTGDITQRRADTLLEAGFDLRLVQGAVGARSW